jgi:hypothetical protein
MCHSQHKYTYADVHGVAKRYTYCYSYSNSKTDSYSHAYSHSNCNSDGHSYGYVNSDAYFETETHADTAAASDTGASPVGVSRKALMWEIASSQRARFRLVMALIEPTYFIISRHASPPGGFLFRSEIPNVIRSALFEIARVLVRFDHVARFIVNANHGVVRTAVEFRGVRN